MEDAQGTCTNPYSLHHAVLERQVLEAASASLEDLKHAGIELTEGWLPEALSCPSDCLAYVTHFDALKRLHMLGELSVDDNEGIVAKMRRCDVFFALALEENDTAHYIFGGSGLFEGWNPTNVVQGGLDAALSAINSYMFGLSLKSRADQLQ
jgi:hypothetical protein